MATGCRQCFTGNLLKNKQLFFCASNKKELFSSSAVWILTAKLLQGLSEEMLCKLKCWFLSLFSCLELFSWLLNAGLVLLEFYFIFFWADGCQAWSQTPAWSADGQSVVKAHCSTCSPSNYLTGQEPCLCVVQKDSCVKLDPAFKDATLASVRCFYSPELQQESLTSDSDFSCLQCFTACIWNRVLSVSVCKASLHI